ncbi:MAG: arsenate reductase ArsC [Candidatus Thermoplasmatota archaeon]|nr:arsenate reductase ArsC [Candidatus Thermoplasmatota archaeon]
MRILFVCVGNTCRSQMAEGWARHLGLEAASAGTHPGPSVAKNAVIVMAEIGIDISAQVPSHIDDFDHSQFDKVFSMGCGVSCPNIPLDGDWELEDPVGQSMEIYRKTRDAIETKIRSIIP